MAGVLKIRDPQLFTMQVRAFGLLQDPYNAIFAVSLPWLELFSGLAVITGVLRRGALWLLNGALLVFLSVLGWAMAAGRQLDCGCFGSAGQLGQSQEFALDGLLLILGVALLRHCSKFRGPVSK